MHIVAVHSWQDDDAAVALIIAETLGILVYEARQKIAGGGPAVVACFADPLQAEALAAKLDCAGVPVLIIDREEVRRRGQPFPVRRFVLQPQALQLESVSGDRCALDYNEIELLLVATSGGAMQSTATVTERKFSLGKTLLAGGIPMSKKVTHEETIISDVRDETLWLYAQNRVLAIFNRGYLNYDGLGPAMQLSRDLNFAQLKNELRRRAPQAIYDERLLKRASLIRVLGPALSPENDLDLALEIFARSLKAKPMGTTESL